MFTILGADGKEYGPVTAAHVHEWIRDGRANLQTKARYGQESDWKTLGSFAEFSRQAVAAASVPPPLPVPLESGQTDATDSILWLRLPAAMIDGFLKGLCYLPVTIPLLRLAVAEALRGKQRTFLEMSQLTNEVLNEHLPHALPWFALLMLVQLCLLAWRGQSVGKLVLGLRIVRVTDNSQAGFVRAFLLRGTVPFLIEEVPFLGLLFWIVDSCFIFSADRRCLHDHLAGTKVIRP